MSSVASSVLISNRSQLDGRRYVRYKFDLLDNVLQTHQYVIGPKLVASDFDTDADMLSLYLTALNNFREREQLELRQRSREGQVVLHHFTTWWEKKVFLWDTWDNHATDWLIYWLSFEDQLELVHAKADIDLISDDDIVTLLGIKNTEVPDVRSALQISADAKVLLNNYSPLFVDRVLSGVKK